MSPDFSHKMVAILCENLDTYVLFVLVWSYGWQSDQEASRQTVR